MTEFDIQSTNGRKLALTGTRVVNDDSQITIDTSGHKLRVFVDDILTEQYSDNKDFRIIINHYKEKSMKLNNGHYFEAMDRCNTMMTMLEELLDGHTAITATDTQKHINKAVKHLMKAYQKIGEQDETWED